MPGVYFWVFGAYLALWLAIYAVVKYAFEDSLPGRVATVLT